MKTGTVVTLSDLDATELEALNRLDEEMLGCMKCDLVEAADNALGILNGVDQALAAAADEALGGGVDEALVLAADRALGSLIG
jgi:hypothetical protein